MADAPPHIFVCRGPDCARAGSAAIQAGLAERLPEGSVRSWGCLTRCGTGVNLVLYPSGAWYSDVEPADLDAIAAHARGGPVYAAKEATVVPAVKRVILMLLDDAVHGRLGQAE